MPVAFRYPCSNFAIIGYAGLEDWGGGGGGGSSVGVCGCGCGGGGLLWYIDENSSSLHEYVLTRVPVRLTSY